MSNCLKCNGAGSWVKKTVHYEKSTRRLRVCKHCRALFKTIELTLPARFTEDLIRILELTAALPKQAQRPGKALRFLRKYLELASSSAGMDDCNRRLEAILAEYPVPKPADEDEESSEEKEAGRYAE